MARVAEVYAGFSGPIEKGSPIFRLDSSKQEAAVEGARRKIAEVEAELVVAPADIFNTAPLSQSFGNPVHCVRLSNDGLVYVCDRVNDRIQVSRKDGTFVKEFRVEPQTLQNGSVWDLVLSSDRQQRFIFIADGANGQIVTIARADGKTLTQWGRHGRQAGQFKWVHNIGIDSKGNLYTAEVGFGRRAKKFNAVR